MKTIILKLNKDGYIINLRITKGKQDICNIKKDPRRKITLSDFIEKIAHNDLLWWKKYSVRVEGEEMAKRIFIDLNKFGKILRVAVMEEDCIYEINISKMEEMPLSDFVEIIARDNEQLFIKQPDLFE